MLHLINVTARLADVLPGSIIQHPAWPTLYWEVLYQLPPLSTQVRLVGTEIQCSLYARDDVYVVETPDPPASMHTGQQWPA